MSALGTENTSFATGWPMRRPIAKSENGWSTGLAKCITSESSVGAVENQNGSDPIPGDEPVLARFGEAHEIPWADAEPTAYAATCLRGCVVSGSVDEAWEHPRTFRKQDRNAAPLPGADRGSRAWRSRQGRLCRLPSRRAADAGISAAAQDQPPGQTTRPQIAGSVPRLRSERTSRRVGEVGASDQRALKAPSTEVVDNPVDKPQFPPPSLKSS